MNVPASGRTWRCHVYRLAFWLLCLLARPLPMRAATKDRVYHGIPTTPL